MALMALLAAFLASLAASFANLAAALASWAACLASSMGSIRVGGTGSGSEDDCLTLS